jgi:hypothetical protein
LAGLYCGPQQQCQPYLTAFPPFAGVACAANESPFKAYFHLPRASGSNADFFRLPFPNDARVTGGQLDLTDFPLPGVSILGVDFVKLYVDTWVAEFDGFSTTAPIVFRLSDEADFSSLSGTTVRLVDLGAGLEVSRSYTYSAAKGKFICQNWVAVRPALSSPLAGGHTYAAILTTGILSKAGAALEPDADLTALLSSTPPSDSVLMAAWTKYQPLRTYLAGGNPAASAVAAATVFTVQDPTAHAKRLAEQVALQPAPSISDLTLCDTGVSSPCSDGTSARSCPAATAQFHELHGKLTVPIFQSGTAPYETPEAGGHIVQSSGVPQVQRTETVCFAMTIPKGVTAPGGGWPLVVYGHGTGGSFRSFIQDGTAERLSTGAAPAAGFALEAVQHGARRGSSTRDPEQLVFNPLNPRGSRDTTLQGAVDVLQALRIASVAVPPTAVPAIGGISFDATKVVYLGHSQGSVMGEPALAFTSAPRAVVLSGAGAFLTSSMLDRTKPTSYKLLFTALLGETPTEFHPVFTLIQGLFDRSDALNYAPLLLRSPPAGVERKHIFMTMGKGDSDTPFSTLSANALALGLPPVGPVVEDYGLPAITRPVSLNLTRGGAARTAAVFQYDPGGAYDGHFVLQRDAAAGNDWTAFVRSYFITGTPTVP